jgi:hypothetical protein
VVAAAASIRKRELSRFGHAHPGGVLPASVGPRRLGSLKFYANFRLLNPEVPFALLQAGDEGLIVRPAVPLLNPFIPSVAFPWSEITSLEVRRHSPAIGGRAALRIAPTGSEPLTFIAFSSDLGDVVETARQHGVVPGQHR